MKQLLLASLLLPAALCAQNTVVLYDGDNNDYASGNPPFNSGSAFGVRSTTSGTYTGPVITAGYELADGITSLANFRIDSNVSSVNDADTLQASAGFGVAGTVYSAFVLDSTTDFTINSDSFFRLNARRQGGKTYNDGVGGAGGTNDAFAPTGLRWVLRDANTGDYYISALNDTNAAQFGANYSTNWGTATTESDPDTISWYAWTPGSGVSSGIDEGTTIANIDTRTFDQGGFFYSNGRVANGGVVMDFAQFEINAVPEPSSYALISGFLALGWMMVRRRR